MKTFARRALCALTGNAFAQRALARIAFVSEYLMGIGAGNSLESSGEHAVFRVLRERVQPPFCIFDVGANAGQFLAMAERELAGHEFHVHSFEPSPVAFARLRRAANGHTSLNNVALGRAAGTATLYASAAGIETASLFRRQLAHFGIADAGAVREDVPVTTLDAYCEHAEVRRIDLLKIDAEGAELNILHGGERMFREGRIALVMFEFGGANIDAGNYFQDYWYFLRNRGMKELLRITPSGYLASVPAYTEPLERFRTTNFLAVMR
jgi:FkbM family methyltransferase